MLQQKELFEFFQQNKTNTVYQKKGSFLSRPAVFGETILTIVAGKLETIKTVTEISIVLRNIEIGSSAETYIISEENFKKRYTKTGDVVKIENKWWSKVFANGQVTGFFYTGEEITILAPWNEPMLVVNGDFIGCPVGGDPNDIYRIEKETFALTYHELDANT